MSHQHKPTHRNYARGADAERRAKLDLLKPHARAHPLFKLGAHHVMRAAGSHGEFDLAAQCAHNDLWLQVKSAPDLKRGARELAKLERWLNQYAKPVPASCYLAGLVWVPREGWLVAARYTPNKVVVSHNAYPSHASAK